VAVLRTNVFQLVDDDLHQQTLARQDRAQPFDGLQQLGKLVEDLLALETGQPLQLHVEDRLRLDLRQTEIRHQAFAGFWRCFRGPDQRDHRVEMVERDLQSFEDVIALLGFAQFELSSPADDLAAELNEALDELQEVQHLRPPADDGEHDDAEAGLQWRMFVEVVENHLRHFAALQLNHNPHAFAVRLVAKIGNALDRFLANQVRDALDHFRFVDLIRNLGDDDRCAIAFLVRLDRRSRAHQDRPAACGVGLNDPAMTHDEAARGEIRSRNQFDELTNL